MNAADYSVTDDTGADIEAGSIAGGTLTGRIVVTFTNEETISGSGNVYTLYATPAGSVAGNTISVAPTRNLAGTVTTGYLVSGSIAGTGLTNPGLASPGINLDTLNDGTADQPGSFVWSDLSEVPHSFAAPGSSFDWTNDVYVEDLTQTQTLTR
jgi:hypothetical protein